MRRSPFVHILSSSLISLPSLSNASSAILLSAHLIWYWDGGTSGLAEADEGGCGLCQSWDQVASHRHRAGIPVHLTTVSFPLQREGAI